MKLMGIAVLAILIVAGLEASKQWENDPLLGDKLRAARRMELAMRIIKAERLRDGEVIDREVDPNETGMIGKEYTDITTTLGSLSSKRTSTNPNFAGLIVEMLSQAGVRPGDDVAVSFSGSFPALNIAVLSATEALGLNPVIISSIGASMYGANDPGRTWLDMERILKKAGVFLRTSIAASLGAVAETHGGLDQKGVELGLEAISRNGIAYLDERGEKTLREDIERRLALYMSALHGRKPAVFINVGGPLTSLGYCPEAYVLPNGFLKKVPVSTHPLRGIIFRMNEDGVPVIHLLNIRKIAKRYGLPIDPVPLPPVPDGMVMTPRTYSLPLLFSGIALLCMAIAWARLGQGKLTGSPLSLVKALIFTIRSDTTRIISVRRARNKEAKLYEKETIGEKR